MSTPPWSHKDIREPKRTVAEVFAATEKKHPLFLQEYRFFEQKPHINTIKRVFFLFKDDL